MSSIIGIIAFLFMLSFIVVIHELGHFLVARYFGVYCHEFSIGMGPAIYQKKGEMTTFSIRAIPFGGYVMMAGENDGSQDEEEGWLKDVPEEQRLYAKSTWKQILILAAGVFMNILIAWVIFVGLTMYRGYVTGDPLPVVYEVVENSPAQAAGLKPDDTIIALEADGEKVILDDQNDMSEFIQYHHNEVDVTVERDGKQFHTKLTPAYDEEMQGYLIGITSLVDVKEIKWYEAFKYGTKDLIDTTATIYRSFAMLFRGKGLENLSGPAGIYSVTTKTVSYGLSSYIALIGIISLNIGIFNLIPIPALDGGRIFILLIEKLLGRKVNQKFVEKIIIGSFILLIGLLVFATYIDLVRMFYK